tara:strand:+ start:2100 stop:2594 length:495 start_codon:yes stop_codon:yes gene_type:complete
MGWFHDLGNKIKGEVHSIGNKIHNAGNKAAKFVHKVAPKIKEVAQEVSGVAGKVASVTEAALPFVQEIPVVGEVADAVAVGAEGIAGVAGGVASAAGMADKLAQDVTSGKAIERGTAAAKSAGIQALGQLASQRSRTGKAPTSADVKSAAMGVGKTALNRFVGN